MYKREWEGLQVGGTQIEREEITEHLRNSVKSEQCKKVIIGIYKRYDHDLDRKFYQIGTTICQKRIGWKDYARDYKAEEIDEKMRKDYMEIEKKDNHK